MNEAKNSKINICFIQKKFKKKSALNPSRSSGSLAPTRPLGAVPKAEELARTDDWDWDDRDEEVLFLR